MLRWITEFFSRLFADTRPESRPGLDPFPKLNLDRLRARFTPAERGRRSGEAGLPPTESNTPDANEHEIQSFIAGEMTTSARIVEDRLKADPQVMQSHGIASPLADIERIRSAAVGNLKVLESSMVRTSSTSSLTAQTACRRIWK